MSAPRIRLEPLLTLVGAYFVHFALTRAAVATTPELAATKPIRGLAAWLFTGWDAEHYLRLAQSFDSYAWPPLYPMGLRALASTGITLEAAAVLINLTAHASIVWLSYEFVRSNPRLVEVPGWLFASLVLFFPLHNVFFAAYSESLFVALVLGACVAYQRQYLWLAGVLCGLSLLTRNMGVFWGAAFLLVELARAISRRQIEYRRLIGVSLWVPFFAAWNVWLAHVGSDPVAATADWQTELLTNHVPAGDSPRLWVLRFIALPPGNHFEWVAFWGLVCAIVYCWIQRLRVESIAIALFLLSFAVYLYRPFPFTRYASSLFPLALMVAHGLRRRPVLQVFTVAGCASMAHWFEVMLFSNRFGEP